jgi:phage RecT family recombinase
MSEIQKQPANPIQSLEATFKAVKNVKDLLKIPVVYQRYVANYEAFSGLKDGKERFEREAFAFMEIANSKPEIMKADPFSIFAGFIKPAAYGIPIQSKKWSIYVRGGKLVVELDAHGKREALENMPSIEKIETSVVVYKDDKFSYNPKLKQVTLHEQSWPTPAASKETVKAVYCVVHFKDGTTKDIAMSIAEIETARSHSPQPNGSTWTKNYAEMAKKTVYNRAFKELYKLPRTAVIYEQFEAPETKDVEHAEVSDVSTPEESRAEYTPTENVDTETGEVSTPSADQNDDESFLPK